MFIRAINPIHFEAGQALYDRRSFQHTYWYFLEWDLLQPALNSHRGYYPSHRHLKDVISFINVQDRIEEVGQDSWFYLTLNKNWSSKFEEISRHCEDCNRTFHIQDISEISWHNNIRRIIEQIMRVENTFGLGIQIIDPVRFAHSVDRSLVNKKGYLFLDNISPLSKRFLYDNKGKNPA